MMVLAVPHPLVSNVDWQSLIHCGLVVCGVVSSAGGRWLRPQTRTVVGGSQDNANQVEDSDVDGSGQTYALQGSGDGGTVRIDTSSSPSLAYTSSQYNDNWLRFSLPTWKKE